MSTRIFPTAASSSAFVLKQIFVSSRHWSSYVYRRKYFSIMYDFIKSGYLNKLSLFFTGIPITSYHLPLLYIVGFLLWTLDEYVIHRWLFHLCPPSKYPVIMILHFLFHGQHHKVNKKNGSVQPKIKRLKMINGETLEYENIWYIYDLYINFFVKQLNYICV